MCIILLSDEMKMMLHHIAQEKHKYIKSILGKSNVVDKKNKHWLNDWLFIDRSFSGVRYPGFLIEWIFYWIESRQIKIFESIFELNFLGKKIIE